MFNNKQLFALFNSQHYKNKIIVMLRTVCLTTNIKKVNKIIKKSHVHINNNTRERQTNVSNDSFRSSIRIRDYDIHTNKIFV